MMNITEGLTLKGEWQILIRDKYTGETRVIALENTLTKIYQNEIIKVLNGTGESFEIKYIAVGTGGTPATSDDTQLVTEIFRRQPTYKSVETGYFKSILVLLPSDANAHIREIGVFYGASATASANTGKLLSRICVDFEKTSSEEVILVRKDIVII